MKYDRLDKTLLVVIGLCALGAVFTFIYLTDIKARCKKEFIECKQVEFVCKFNRIYCERY